jgi:putative endopeptidase
MNRFKILFLSLVVALALTSCHRESPQVAFNDPLLTNRDTTVNPADDFFRFANGGWFKNHPIPDSERSNGIFRTIQDTINAQIKDICVKSAADKQAQKGSNVQKIGAFYASGMDTIQIEKNGITPLKAEFARIEAIKDIPSLMQNIAYLQRIGVDQTFSFYIGQDDKNSSKYALFFGQGGLGMGNRDYYFNTDPETVEIRKEYVKHLQAMMQLIGEDSISAQKQAATIMKMETEMAKSSRKLEALRDPIKNYNKMSLQQFEASTPKIAWNQVLAEFGISKADSVIVGQPEFFKSLHQMLQTYSLNDWKTYLKWHTVNTYAEYLNQDIASQNFKFYSTVMSGVKVQKPRWKRVVEDTNSRLGELIGQIYVDQYLPKGSKEKLLEIGNNVKAVYAERLKNLDWMSDSTKTKALHKLSKIVMKVGYPDDWKDMSKLDITRNSYFENVKATNIWWFQYNISKYGKPVDRTEWSMYPQTYNAYYNPSNNEIVVPACNILVPGFEGRMPDDAILYGIIGGSTFGHEITHGFDDQGSQYDELGNLNNWWTASDLTQFRMKTKLIVDQYNLFEPLKGKFVNGDATQGENIADLGGVIMGLEAFKKTAQFKNKTIISGMTPEQRYFNAYAYAWMVQIKPESLAQQMMVDVHSPAECRINGPLANIPEFYDAFKIKPGSKMRQADSLRVEIW